MILIYPTESESSLHNGGKLPDLRVARKHRCLAKAASHRRDDADGAADRLLAFDISSRLALVDAVGRELVCYHGLTANQWALDSAVECFFTRSPSTHRLLTLKRLDRVSNGRYRYIRRYLVRFWYAWSAGRWQDNGGVRSPTKTIP